MVICPIDYSDTFFCKSLKIIGNNGFMELLILFAILFCFWFWLKRPDGQSDASQKRAYSSPISQSNRDKEHADNALDFVNLHSKKLKEAQA
jgi:hypothetical protein